MGCYKSTQLNLPYVLMKNEAPKGHSLESMGLREITISILFLINCDLSLQPLIFSVLIWYSMGCTIL